MQAIVVVQRFILELTYNIDHKSTKKLIKDKIITTLVIKLTM